MNNTNNLSSTKKIAVVAYDIDKSELIEWSYENRSILAQHNVIASGETAALLEGTTSIKVITLPPAELGGYQQLAEMIITKTVDIIFFFGDPRKSNPQHNGIKDLLPLASGYEVLISCNKVSADLILKSLRNLSFQKARDHAPAIGKSVLLQKIGKPFLKIASLVF